jgi:hypothetical protein
LTARGLIVAHRATRNWLLVYGSLIILAEAILVLVNVAVGVLLQAAVLVVVVSHHALARSPRDPLLPVLALVPLIRLLSIAMPIPGTAPIFTYVLVGAPALLGALLTARAIGASRAELGLGRPTSLLEPAKIATIGLPLGLVARSVGGVSPMAIGDAHPVLFLVIVTLCVVLLEELVFRGLLQRAATTRSRLLGIVTPNVLYAAMYFGSGSAAAVLFMGLTGSLFGWVVSRSGSLWGVIAAHVLMRVVIQI